jgi:RNA polymerase sigma factor (TIGR02999 family)
VIRLDIPPWLIHLSLSSKSDADWEARRMRLGFDSRPAHRYGSDTLDRMFDLQASNCIARLMADFRKGDRAAASRLIELLYPELRKIAAVKMRGERAQHTWQPTVLVNELYLALVKAKALGGAGSSDDDEERSAFLRLSGHIMRHLLVDHARPLHRRATKVELQETPVGDSLQIESLQFVEETLSRLEAVDPKLRTVIELKVFEGLTGDEIARRLGCSPRTAANYWAFARNWLERELGNIDQEPV